MGKALLFIVTAASLGGGLLLYQTQDTRLGTTGELSEHGARLIASEAAQSGLNVGLADARLDFDARPARTDVTSTTDPRASYDLEMAETAQATLLVTATGRFEGHGGTGERREFWQKAERITAELARTSLGGAAIVVNSPAATVQYTGAAFELSGIDSRPGSLVADPFANPEARAPAGAGQSRPAVIGSSETVLTAFRPGGAGQSARVVGVNGENDVVLGTLPEHLATLFEEAASQADDVVESDYTASSAMLYGTPRAPRIAYIKGDATFDVANSSGFVGHGVLLVEGDLRMRGNFEWNGIVFVRKDGALVLEQGGDARIYGALIVDNPSSVSDDEGGDHVEFEIGGDGTVTVEDQFVAEVSVIGSALDTGSYSLPVTAEARIGSDRLQPWGNANDPEDGNVNDAQYPKPHAVSTPYPAGTQITVTGRSWIPRYEYVYKKGRWVQEATGFDRHMEATAGGSGSRQVWVLRDGDRVPDTQGWGSQQDLSYYVADYTENGYITLDENQVIYLFELWTTDLRDATADFQDLVVLVTFTPVSSGNSGGGGDAAKSWTEAEEAGGNWGTVRTSDTASGGSYLVRTGSSSTWLPPLTATPLSLTFSGTGPFAIWARVYAPNSSSDSFWMMADGVNGGWPVAWTISGAGAGWTWVKWETTTALNDGEHTLRISYRESGTMLDKILITTNLNYTPTGMGESNGTGQGGAEASSLAFSMGDRAFVRYSEEAIGRLADRIASIGAVASVERIAQRTTDPTMPDEVLVPDAPGGGQTGGGETGGGENELITICHKYRQSRQTMQINPNALQGHLGHGDTVGVCPSGD